MKKIIISIVLSVVLLICMTACSEIKIPGLVPGGDITPPVSAKIYEKLDDFADINYQQINLDVITVTGGVQLSANYTLTQSDVIYSVEQLNILPSDGDFTGTSTECKTTHTGSAKIVEGKITEMNNKGITLPSYDELKGNFNFDESNLKNVVTLGNSLSADVILPSNFYGSEVNVQNMKINVEYTETALSKITITYQTTHSTVTTTYEFIN